MFEGRGSEWEQAFRRKAARRDWVAKHPNSSLGDRLDLLTGERRARFGNLGQYPSAVAAPPAQGITVTPWILLSAGGLMVLIGVASGSVLARIIFGRRGDLPGLRAHAETNLSNRSPSRGENNTERNPS